MAVDGETTGAAGQVEHADPRTTSPRSRLLRNRDFGAFWASQTLSSAGDSLVQLALPFAVLRVHNSPLTVGLAVTVYGVARVVALPLGGAIGDAYSRRTLLLASEAVKLAVYLALTAAFALGAVDLSLLIGCTAVYGIAYGLGMPAATAVLPQTVKPDRLQRANAFLSLSKNIAQVLGFVVSGLVIAQGSTAVAYSLAAALFALATAVLTRMRVGTGSRLARSSLFHDLAESWSVVRSHRWYWLNLVTHGLWNMSYAVFFVAGPIAATQYLGGTTAWSALSVAVAVGGVGGSLIAAVYVPKHPLLYGNLAMASLALAFAGFGAHAPLVALCALTTFAFAGPAVLNVMWATTVQEHVPRSLLSRLSSYDWMVSLSTVPLGSALAGWSLEEFGLRATALWALCCALIPGAVALVDPEMRGLRRMSVPDRSPESS